MSPKKTMKLENLKEIGLSTGEIKVYKALLDLGISGLQKIQEKTGIERRNIYDILNKLIDKGIVSYTIEKGKRIYQCTNPNILLDLVKKREENLKKIQEDFPSIKNLYETKKPNIKVEIYRGKEAIKTLLQEMLDYKESFWMGGNSFENYKSVPKGLQYYFENWMKQRVKKKHMMHDLVSHGTSLEGLEPKKIKKHKKEFYKYCQLPKGIYVPMVIIIFGNKVIQVQWGEEPFAVEMDSPKVKESFLNYFNYFWKDTY